MDDSISDDTLQFEGSLDPDLLPNVSSASALLHKADGSLGIAGDGETQNPTDANMVEKASSGRKSPIRKYGVKEVEQQIVSLEKENFDLKLRIYFLEQQKGVNKDAALKTNIDLKVQLESIQKEFQDKQAMWEQLIANYERHVQEIGEQVSQAGTPSPDVQQLQAALDEANNKLVDMETQLQEAAFASETQVQDREAELDSLRKALHKQTKDKKDQTIVTNTLNDRVGDLEGQLVAMAKKLEFTERKLVDKDIQLKKSSPSSELEKVTRSYEEKINKVVTQLQQLQDDMKQKDGILQNRDAELAARGRAIDQRDQKLISQGKEIQELKISVEQLINQLRLKENELSDAWLKIQSDSDKHAKDVSNHQLQINQLQGELGQKQLEIESLTHRAAFGQSSQNGTLEQMRAAILEKDQTIASLVASGNEKDALLARLQQSTPSEASFRNSDNAAVSHLCQENTLLKKEIAALKEGRHLLTDDLDLDSLTDDSEVRDRLHEALAMHNARAGEIQEKLLNMSREMVDGGSETSSLLKEQVGALMRRKEGDQRVIDSLKKHISLMNQSGVEFDPKVIEDMAWDIHRLEQKVKKLQRSQSSSARSGRSHSRSSTRSSVYREEVSNVKRQLDNSMREADDLKQEVEKLKLMIIKPHKSGVPLPAEKSKLESTEALVRQYADDKKKLTDKVNFYQKLLEEAGILSAPMKRVSSLNNLRSASPESRSPQRESRSRIPVRHGSTVREKAASSDRNAGSRGISPRAVSPKRLDLSKYESYGDSEDVPELQHQVGDLKHELERYLRIINALREKIRFGSGQDLSAPSPDASIIGSQILGAQFREKNITPAKLATTFNRLGSSGDSSKGLNLGSQEPASKDVRSTGESKARTPDKHVVSSTTSPQPSVDEHPVASSTAVLLSSSNSTQSNLSASHAEAVKENARLKELLSTMMAESQSYGRPSELKRQLDDISNELEQKKDELCRSFEQVEDLTHMVTSYESDIKEKDEYIDTLEDKIRQLEALLRGDMALGDLSGSVTLDVGSRPPSSLHSVPMERASSRLATRPGDDSSVSPSKAQTTGSSPHRPVSSRHGVEDAGIHSDQSPHSSGVNQSQQCVSLNGSHSESQTSPQHRTATLSHLDIVDHISEDNHSQTSDSSDTQSTKVPSKPKSSKYARAGQSQASQSEFSPTRSNQGLSRHFKNSETGNVDMRHSVEGSSRTSIHDEELIGKNRSNNAADYSQKPSKYKPSKHSSLSQSETSSLPHERSVRSMVSHEMDATMEQLRRDTSRSIVNGNEISSILPLPAQEDLLNTSKERTDQSYVRKLFSDTAVSTATSPLRGSTVQPPQKLKSPIKPGTTSTTERYEKMTSPDRSQIIETPRSLVDSEAQTEDSQPFTHTTGQSEDYLRRYADELRSRLSKSESEVEEQMQARLATTRIATERVAEMEEQIARLNLEKSQSHAKLNQLTNSQADAEKELGRSREQLSKLSKEKTNSQARLDEVNNQLLAVRSKTSSQIHELQKELTQSQEEITKLYDEKAQSQAKLNQLNQQFTISQAGSERQLSNMKRELVQSQEQMSTLSKERSQSQVKIDQLHQQFANAQTGTDNQLGYMQKALAESRDEISVLNEEKSRSNARIDQLHKQLADVQNGSDTQLTYMQKELSQSHEQISKLNNEKRQLKARNEQLNSQFTTDQSKLTSQIGQLQEELTQSQEEILKLYDEKTGTVGQLGHMQKELAESQEEISKLNQEKSKSKVRVDQLHQQLANVQTGSDTQLTYMQKELSQSHEQISNLNKEKRQLQSQKEQLNSQLAADRTKTASQMDQLQKELTHSQQEIVKLYDEKTQSLTKLNQQFAITQSESENQLKRELAQSREQVTTLSKEKDQVENKVDQLHQQLLDAQSITDSQLTHMQNELTQSRKQISALRKGKSESMVKVDQLHQQLANVQTGSDTQLGYTQKELAQARDEISKLNQEKSTSETRIDQLHQQLADVQNGSSTQLTYMQKELSQSHEQISKLNKEKRQLKARNEQLNSQFTTDQSKLTSQIGQLQQELTQSQEEITKLYDEKAQSQAKLNQLNQQFTISQAGSERQLSDMKRELVQSQEQMSTLSKEKSQSQAKIDQLHQQLTNVQTGSDTQLTYMQKALSESRDEISKLNEVKSRSNARIDQLQQQFTSIQTQSDNPLSDMQSELSQSREEISRLRRMNSQSQAGYERIASSETELGSRLAQLEKELAESREQVAQLNRLLAQSVPISKLKQVEIELLHLKDQLHASERLNKTLQFERDLLENTKLVDSGSGKRLSLIDSEGIDRTQFLAEQQSLRDLLELLLQKVNVLTQQVAELLARDAARDAREAARDASREAVRDAVGDQPSPVAQSGECSLSQIPIISDQSSGLLGVVQQTVLSNGNVPGVSQHTSVDGHSTMQHNSNDSRCTSQHSSVYDRSISPRSYADDQVDLLRSDSRLTTTLSGSESLPSTRAPLYAVSELINYEMLKKQNSESLVVLSGLEARVQGRLDGFTATSPLDNMEWCTLRELKICTDNLRTTLFAEKHHITQFVIRQLPGDDVVDRDKYCELKYKYEKKCLRSDRLVNQLKDVAKTLSTSPDVTNEQMRRILSSLLGAKHNLNSRSST